MSSVSGLSAVSGAPGSAPRVTSSRRVSAHRPSSVNTQTMARAIRGLNLIDNGTVAKQPKFSGISEIQLKLVKFDPKQALFHRFFWRNVTVKYIGIFWCITTVS